MTRTGWTGELGYELYLSTRRAASSLEPRDESGQRYNIAPTGPSDIRRIEAGILNYGIDMTLDNNLYEVGLERLVNLDKPADFIDGDALAAHGEEGQEAAEGRLPAPMDMNMTRYREERGFVTRVDSRVRRTSATRWYRWNTAARTRLEIPGAGRRPAKCVVPMPFIDPKRRSPSR